MNSKLVFALLLASVCITGVLGSVISANSSHIDREFESWKERDVENLRGKYCIFANFCLSVLDGGWRDFETPYELLFDNRNETRTIESIRLYQDLEERVDKLLSILEDPTTSLTGRLMESSNFFESLPVVASKLTMYSRSRLTQEEINASAYDQITYRELKETSKIFKSGREEIKQKFQIEARDASILDVKIEQLDCISLKEILKSDIMFIFLMNNAALIQALYAYGK